MSYRVLARKHRPQTFQQVVHQEHVTRTLANAISSGRVAHGILFSGPRGTGKTTVARILAKAMNCKNGPTADPCNDCPSCIEITAGSATDVYEIDGASNNSVDQIRELRENIKYMPANSLYKIYIIDEVHMLSIAAFNALLKTLEEPPEHVMFVFATTESHKIPATILSRCQRHDFRRIEAKAISEYLAMICQREQMAISDDSLRLMAQEAEGSMRDALSLLDQVMACAEDEIDYQLTLDILGVVDRKIISDISKAILDGNIAGALDSLDEIYNRGHDIKKLYVDLMSHFRNLLIARMGKNADRLIDLPAHDIASLKAQVKDTPVTYLQQIIDLLFREDSAIRFSSQPKLALEMIFIRLLQSPPALPIDVLIEKLDLLRNDFQGTAAPSKRISGAAPVASEPNEAQTHLSPMKDEQQESNSSSRQASQNVYATPDPTEIWEKFTGAVSDQNSSLAANLSRCQLRSVTDERLELDVKANGFTVNMLRRIKNIAILKKVYRELFGHDIEIVIHDVSASNDEKQKNQVSESKLKNKAISHPRVADAIEIFDGKLLDVKLLD